MVGLISAYIEHFTYLGLFVVLMLCGLGLPIPEDVALLAGGYLAHRGITRYPITLAVSLLGVVTGDNSLFFMGRRFGTGLVRYLAGVAGPAASDRAHREFHAASRGSRDFLRAIPGRSARLGLFVGRIFWRAPGGVFAL